MKKFITFISMLTSAVAISTTETDVSTTNDYEWKAVDKNGDGHFDTTEIPWLPNLKYENGHVINRDGVIEQGFDYDENEQFIFYVPTTFYDVSFEDEVYSTIETKPYYDEVVRIRDVANKLRAQAEGKAIEKRKTSEVFTVDGIGYKILDYNGNGIIDLYNEETGYISNEAYDCIYQQNEDGTEKLILQLFERTASGQKDYDKDFGDYVHSIAFWNGEKIVTGASTMPTKHKITETMVERYRDLAFRRYCAWYGDDSKSAQQIQQEINKKQDAMQKVKEDWMIEDGSMANGSSGDYTEDLYLELYQKEIENYSHQYDIDDACYISLRKYGVTPKDALESCATYNSAKAVEYNANKMKENEDWFVERIEQTKEIIESNWFTELYNSVVTWFENLINNIFKR